MRSTLVALCLANTVILGGLAPARSAHARSVEDCKARWGSAVRSYLTKNQRAGPSGKVPATLDEAEEVALAWVDLFAQACRLESEGRRRKARLLAATLGTATLARLDQVACQRFLHYFMKAKAPEEVCRAATGAPPERLEARLAAALEHHERLAVPWVSKRQTR